MLQDIYFSHLFKCIRHTSWFRDDYSERSSFTQTLFPFPSGILLLLRFYGKNLLLVIHTLVDSKSTVVVQSSSCAKQNLSLKKHQNLALRKQVKLQSVWWKICYISYKYSVC